MSLPDASSATLSCERPFPGKKDLPASQSLGHDEAKRLDHGFTRKYTCAAMSVCDYKNALKFNAPSGLSRGPLDCKHVDSSSELC